VPMLRDTLTLVMRIGLPADDRPVPCRRKQKHVPVMTTNALSGQIADWVPEAARRRINELRETPLGADEENCRLLTRLATYEVMRTEVWGKLPSVPKDFERCIIDWAFAAFTLFPVLRRPFPKTKSKKVQWANHRAKHLPLTDPSYLSGLAGLLWEEISKCKTGIVPAAGGRSDGIKGLFAALRWDANGTSRRFVASTNSAAVGGIADMPRGSRAH
jgi:hypothetical protein